VRLDHLDAIQRFRDATRIGQERGRLQSRP
jgi:hypothetical protein